MTLFYKGDIKMTYLETIDAMIKEASKNHSILHVYETIGFIRGLVVSHAVHENEAFEAIKFLNDNCLGNQNWMEKARAKFP